MKYLYIKRQRVKSNICLTNIKIGSFFCAIFRCRGPPSINFYKKIDRRNNNDRKSKKKKM